MTTPDDTIQAETELMYGHVKDLIPQLAPGLCERLPVEDMHTIVDEYPQHKRLLLLSTETAPAETKVR